MGLFSSIGKALKGVVSGLAKVADLVAPLCSFIPGLNPVVTAIAAGIKAVNGLTDKPPNLGKMFEGVMGMIPGGALGKVLGPFAKLGGGTAGKFAEMFAGAAAGEKGGVGGLLGDVLSNVLGSKLIGGKDSALGSLATSLFGSLADKLRSAPVQSSLSELINRLTQTGPADVLSANQIAQALSQPTGKTVGRFIEGEVQQVPEFVIHPELRALFDKAVGQVTAEANRGRSTFQAQVIPLVQL